MAQLQLFLSKFFSLGIVFLFSDSISIEKNSQKNSILVLILYFVSSCFRICLQVSSGSYSGVDEILEEFFSVWVFKDDHYVLNDAGLSAKRFHGTRHLEIDEYMEVVELYTFGVLGKVSNDLGVAISWVEKATLPEERRQVTIESFHEL